jgi:predicted RNA-binding Zn-ribbon protein involved in translation (DUF1610 family)
VAKIFIELGAIRKGQEITTHEILRHLGIEKMPNNLGIPMGKMKKSGEIIASTKIIKIEVNPSPDLMGKKVRKYTRTQRMDCMYLNKREEYKVRYIKSLIPFMPKDPERISESVEATTWEFCPKCEQDVEIPTEITYHKCPNCGEEILPCSVCPVVWDEMQELIEVRTCCPIGVKK